MRALDSVGISKRENMAIAKVKNVDFIVVRRCEVMEMSVGARKSLSWLERFG